MPKGKPKTRERLNERQIAFLDHLFRGLPQTRAYCEAYGKDPSDDSQYNSAKSEASRLMQNPNIIAELERRRKLRETRIEATTARIAEELAHIAFVDPIGSGYVRLIDGEMYLSDSAVLPENLRRSIASLEPSEYGVKVKFHKKGEALRMLGQWRKMFVDKLEIDISNRLADRMRRARERRAQQAAPQPPAPDTTKE